MLRVRPTAVAVLLAGAGVLSVPVAAGAAAGAGPGRPATPDRPATVRATPPRTAPAPETVVADGRDAGPLDVRRTSLVQDGPDLRWSLRTGERWDAARLQGGAGRRICLSTSRHGREAHRACVVRKGSGLALRATDIGDDGQPVGWRASTAAISRPGRTGLEVVGAPADLVGRETGVTRWYATTAWQGGDDCLASAPCSDRVPATGSALYHVRRAVQAGCVASGPTSVTRGPAARGAVALTFDDGPWTHTAAFLDELHRLGVPATFFLIGRQVAGNEALLRRMVQEGNAVGNHTWSHVDVGGGGNLEQITSTNQAIQRAVGFAPCLFRPPGGARGSALDGELSSLGMLDVTWTIDTDDWQLPGTPAVVARASAATAGSIVLMHDGGGPRDATLAALPAIVAHLRAKGLRLVTVPELLGLTPRWQYR
ncbi:polysaccharide deacetylase family protein [Patulibacter sp. NPDC049589]|uniref:polysaccharide deacetylase family protein n=1 Tax=Patulibacter sp. NPDC049589 TaxID=3154731 RepID=UPI003448B9C5